MSEASFALGDVFPSMKEARQALQRHTEQQGIPPYRVKKAESSRYIAVCRGDNQCDLYIRIHWRSKEQNAVVSTYRKHTCCAPTPAAGTLTEDTRATRTRNGTANATAKEIHNTPIQPIPAPPIIHDPFPFHVGDTFPTLKDAQQALLRHMAHRKLSYRVKKAESSRYIAVCRSGDSCTFYVRISWRNREQVAAVSTYKPHTCNPETHDNWPATSSVKYLSEKHQANPNLKPADIKRLELEQGNRVTFKQAWRTLKFVRGDLGEPLKKSRAERAKERWKLRKKVKAVGSQSQNAVEETSQEVKYTACGLG